MSNLVPIAEFEKFFHVSAALQKKIRTRMNVRTVDDEPTHELNVPFVDTLGIREYHGNVTWNGHLIDTQIRIGRDDRAAAKVHSFSAQVAAKSTLFAFEALAKTTREFFWLF